MFTRLPQTIILTAILFVVGLFSYAQADDTSNVTIQVKDKRNRDVPFASVIISSQSPRQTGPAGEPARFDIDLGQYRVTSTHPYVLNRRDDEATANKNFRITRRRQSANILLKLNGNLVEDSSGPALTQVAPLSSDRLMNDEPISFRIMAQDPETQVAMVQARLDGQLLPGPTVSGSNYSWVTPAIAIGSHEIVYTAWNSVGTTTINNWRFTVNPVVGQLTGLVSFAGQPVTDATVRLDTNQTIITDATGRYLLTNVAAGNRLVTVSAPDLSPQNQPITVNKNVLNSLDLVLVDGVAPLIPADLAVANTNPTTGQQTVSWAGVTDRSGVSYEVRRLQGGTVQETKTVTGTTITFGGLNSNIEYTYVVRAKDGATPTNVSDWSTSVKRTTQSLPAISWIQPTVNQSVSGAIDLQASYQVVGAGRLVNRVEIILLPSTSLGSATPNNQTGTAVLTWNSATTTNGNQSLRAMVTDNEGNSNQAEVAIQVNNPGSVSGVVSYGGNPINNAAVRLNTGQSVSTNTAGQYAINSLADGNYLLTVSASGLSDKTEALTIVGGQNLTLNVAMSDGVAPSIPANISVNNIRPTASNQEVTWSASTDISGIKEYEIQRLIGSTVVETKTVAGLSVGFDNLTNNTNYSYKVRAKDNANPSNASNWSGVITKRTQRSPIVQWVAPLPNQNLRDSVTLDIDYWVFSSAPSRLQWMVQPDNQIIATTNPINTSGQVNVSWNTNSALNGAKTLRVSITDNEDNSVSADLIESVANPNTLTGTITEQGSSAIVPDATVEIWSGSNLITSGNVNGSGVYQLTEIVDGTYAVKIRAEGYQDTTVSNVQLPGGTTTLNSTMVLLPRVTLDGTVRELAGPGGNAFNYPAGVAVKPGTNTLIVAEKNGSKVHYYNATSESYIRSITVYDSDMLAFDNQGFMAVRYGHSYWVNNDDTTTEGPILGFSGLAASPEGNIYMVDGALVFDGGFLRRFVNRRQNPSTGYDLRPITASNQSRAVAASNKNVFVVNKYNRLYRLSQSNPTDINQVISVDLGFSVAQIHYINNTRVLAVAEAGAKKIHLFDTRTLQEYSFGEISNNFSNISGLGLSAYIDPSGNIKVFATTSADSKVHILTGRSS